jgi:hypothetical protein
MTIYQSLDEIRRWIAHRDWDGLEAEFSSRCERVDPSAADRIEAIRLGDYEGFLRAALDRVQSAEPINTQAIYWEFNPDSGWQSAFFQCLGYQPEAAGDDEWASDFDEANVLEGPDAPGLAAEFATDWDRSDRSIAKNAYLVARTIATFGRASSAWHSRLPLCAGHHDQELLYRVCGE